MNLTKTALLLTISALLAASVNAAFAGSGSVKIYLPREVTVKEATLHLGQIGIIKGDDELSQKIEKTEIARFSAPGQTIVVERATVLGRLASQGIDLSRVSLTGARKVSVRTQQRIIQPEDFVQVARNFIKQKSPSGLTDDITAIRRPEQMVLSQDYDELSFECNYKPTGNDNAAIVTVHVIADGNSIGRR